RKKKNRRTAARIKIATLNMKGRGSIPPDLTNDKWSTINQIMRDKKLALVAVQETHLTTQHVEDLHTLFGKRLKILHSEPTDRASSSQGIAFVLNKERLNTSDARLRTIIPGRAALLSLTWHKQVHLKILNVYAPNDRAENELFWKSLAETWRNESIPNPDIMTGDFNVVEERKDRLPERADHAGSIHALQDLCIQLRLVDTWREQYPDKREYTYVQDHGTSMSRLDRIYINHRLGKNANEWLTEPADSMSTDHLLHSVMVADDKIPYVGSGRWNVPKAVISDHEFINYVTEQGKKFIHDVQRLRQRTTSRNPQTLYQSFKTDILERARALAKINIPKLVKRIDKLKLERTKTLNTPEPRDEHLIATQAAALLERIRELEARRFNTTRKAVATKDWTHGEKITKYWVQ
ncbi:DNase I-like protein, partial [Trametopsis cervina]